MARPMTAADLPAVRELFALSFPDKLVGMLPGRPAQAAALLAHAALRGGDAWVTDGGRVTGVVTLQDAALPWYRHASWGITRRGLPPFAALRASLFLAAFHVADFPASELYLETMAVHPDARGAGVGGALLHHAEAEARRRGRSSVSLYCLTSNTRALALYERSGYRFVHREDLWWCAPVLGYRFTDLLRKHLGQPAGTSFSKKGCAPGSAVMHTEP